MNDFVERILIDTLQKLEILDKRLESVEKTIVKINENYDKTIVRVDSWKMSTIIMRKLLIYFFPPAKNGYNTMEMVFKGMVDDTKDRMKTCLEKMKKM